MSTGSVICIIGLIFILCYGVKIAPKGEWVRDSFSLEHARSMKGFCVAGTIVHLLSVVLSSQPFYNQSLTVFHECGVFFVGFFFFCSGYGLVFRLRTKENYLKGFVGRRVAVVLIPFFICNYLFMLISLLLGTRYAFSDLVFAFFGLKLLNNQMWFAIEIMILYLCFYLVFSCGNQDFYTGKAKKGIPEWACYLLIFLVIVGFAVIGMVTGHNRNDIRTGTWFHGEWWFNTTPLFFIGMLAARFYEQLEKFIKRYYAVLLTLTAAAFVILVPVYYKVIEKYGYWTDQVATSTSSSHIIDKLITFGVQLPTVILFVFLLVLMMKKVKFQNGILTFLGRISLEILLISNVIFQILNYLFHHFELEKLEYATLLYVLFSTAGALIASFVLYKIKKIIIGRT